MHRFVLVLIVMFKCRFRLLVLGMIILLKIIVMEVSFEPTHSFLIIYMHCNSSCIIMIWKL